MKNPAVIIALILIIAIDQISKTYVLTASAGMIKLNDFINITHVWNTGVSFGLFAGTSSNVIFTCLTTAIAITIAYLLFRASSKYMRITYIFMLGGALGNLIDRIRYGAVFDFIDIHIGNIHWHVFNFADFFICLGGAMLLCSIFFNKKTSI